MSSAAQADLGDALADVVTFGAFGAQRDLHAAEMEQLKAHFAEQLQLEKNSGETAVHTARIEEKVKNAANSQGVGQQVLLILAEIDLVEEQLKEIIRERYRINTNVSRFSQWFDSFASGDNDKLNAILDLIAATKPGDDASIQAAIKAARLDQAIAGADADTATAYLKNALADANSGSTTQALTSLEGVRVKLVAILESQRQNVRTVIVEMLAEDVARRKLCTPGGIYGVAQRGDGKYIYYSASSTEPLPCNDGITYLNIYPVSAVSAITEDLQNYGPNAEFFVNLTKIGTHGQIDGNRFRSPQEVFGDELHADKLLPAAFLQPRGCGDVDRLAKRLNDGLDYLTIFANAQDRSADTKKVIAYAQDLRPVLDFWVANVKKNAPSDANCHRTTAFVRQQLDSLRLGVAAVESYGTAVSAGSALAADAASLSALDAIAGNF
jgi:hypothetical protein